MEDKENKKSTKSKSKELGVSCMLNTEVGALLAVIRRAPESTPTFYHHPDDMCDASLLQSLKSLRALLFNPQQEWRMVDPSIYISPFLDVIQSDDIPAAATAVALQSILKILRLGIFDENTPGAKDAINSAVTAITGCRLEKSNPITEDAVMMRILQVLTAIMRHRASFLLTDNSACTVVNTCFQVVQQSANRGDLLQRSARHTMHELIQIIYSRLPDIEVKEWENDESDTEDNNLESGYGIRSAVDIFHFLCSLLNVVDIMESDGMTFQVADENIQVFALCLINSAIELSGDSIGKHPKLLRMIQDDLFHHLIHYGTCSSPLVLSMICSTVLNLYHFLRRSMRLQLEAFFSFVLFRVATPGNPLQLQEVAVEGLVNFCRQPTFIIEVYVNYDCDPTFRNVFEETGKLLCKYAFPTGGVLTSIQIQAFEGLSVIFHNIADRIDKEDDPSPYGPYPVEISGYRPFWEEKCKELDDIDTWVDYLRVRKVQKRKILIAGSHFNRDDKKGLEYLKYSKLISEPPDPKAYAMFFRYTPRLDKTMIGNFLGDPDAFHIQVLKEFTHTFEFTGMVLDTALRTYLETFRLPGESQKIQRILEAFSEKYYDQQSADLFASKDAVMILCYSIIMLNTDQHNPQVKKKMTEEDFIRNNRSINAGQDLPREYLSEVFQSIATNAISLDQSSTSAAAVEMTPNRWIQLINRAKIIQPFILCNFDRRLGRDMFASIAGPSVATLGAVFEQSDEEDILHECIEALFSIARIAQYGLEDTLDELLCSFSKFTTLLNPYASAEETLYAFSHDTKPKMAMLAVFTIANTFKDSVKGGWRTIVDCLLKLKRLKLLPQSMVETDSSCSNNQPMERLESSGVLFPNHDSKFGNKRHSSGIMARFLNFMSMESVEEALNLGLSEFEQNMKIIQQCRIGSIFSTSFNLPEDSLLNLGRCIIFAAAGKGQKFSTPVEEEDTVGFCWELITSIGFANTHRFSSFWPYYHDYLLEVAQFPLFSPIPFAEKAIISLTKICLKLVASAQTEGSEELIFKSINLMWRMEKEILETCCDFLLHSAEELITKYPKKLQTQLGWMSVLHLLSATGRHPETYDQGVEILITLMSDQSNITRTNYTYLTDCAFAFVALRNSRVEKNIKIMDLLAESASLLVEWYRAGYSDPGSNTSVASNVSGGTNEDNTRIYNPISFFQRLGESLKKTSLARREEVRNHAVSSLQRSFILAEDLLFTPTNCINSFYNVIFAMVDDLHEKMLQYSRRDNAERETRCMEGTLKLSMEVLTEVYLHFLKPISESSSFRTFWLGILRRMDTCMKADLGEYGESKMPEVIPDLLRKIVLSMKEREILTKAGEDDLWETTYYQIQWIAPALTDELFPEGLKSTE